MALKGGAQRVRYFDPAWGKGELSPVLEFLAGGDDESHVRRLILDTESRFGTRALPTDSGRSAIALGVRALGLGRGDEIVAPSYVCPAAVNPILDCGCQVRFADIDDSMCLDPASVEAAITKKTKGMVIVHLYGRMARVDELREIAEDRGLRIIDDAASAYGAQAKSRLAGTFGDVGILGFGAGKIIASLGGGVLLCGEDIHRRAVCLLGPTRRRLHVVLDSLDAAGRAMPWTRLGGMARILRRLSGTSASFGEWHGSICRMPGVAAAVAMVQLERHDRTCEVRRDNWAVIEDTLGGLRGVRVLPGGGEENAMQECPIVVPPDRVLPILEGARRSGYELETGWKPLHLLSRFSSCGRVGLPVTESVWRGVILVPVHPNVTVEDARAMAGIVKAGIGGKRLN
jgi:perosamine synthetase